MGGQSQYGLLRQRRFGPFFLTQALGAFNDNLFKNALVILVTFGIAGLAAEQIAFYVNLAAGLFILPFFLFSTIVSTAPWPTPLMAPIPKRTAPWSFTVNL
mgnify:CR=1 FL=1